MTTQQQDGFGQMIRSMRQAQKPPLALRELARRCGISAAYLSNIERGLCAAPSAEVVKTLARELNSDPADFLRKANRTDPEFFAEAMDPGVVTILRLVDALAPTDSEPFLNMKNILAYLFTEFDGRTDDFSEMELFACFMTAFGKLRLEKDNPSQELQDRLARGIALLKTIMPDLFKEGSKEEIIREIYEMTDQKKQLGSPEGDPPR